MLVGNDISNFQGQIDWPTYIRNSNFVICKASEGTGYIDTWFGYNRSQARLFNLPRGWYHFARPDYGNTPQQEADFFCNLMNGDPLEEGELIMLDFEVNYGDPINWCKQWLDEVTNKLGVKPLIYLNQSLATSFDWQPVVDAGYGLWIAAYTYDPTNNNFQSGKWAVVAMQQWTDNQSVPGVQGVIDGDVFFGDQEAFKKYGYHAPAQPVQEPQVTPTPEIPIPVTTTSGSTVVNVSTNPPPSATTTTSSKIGSATIQSAPLTMPQKPPMTMGSTIVWVFTNIFNTLKRVIYGKA